MVVDLKVEYNVGKGRIEYLHQREDGWVCGGWFDDKTPELFCYLLGALVELQEVLEEKGNG